MSDSTSLQELIASNLELLRSGKYSDFVLKCEDQVYNLHRSIVCPQSAVLAKALDGPFQESKSRIFHANEDDPNSIARAINYCYRLDYTENGDLSIAELATSETEPAPVENKEDFDFETWWAERTAKAYAALLAHIAAYTVADKYEIKGMMELAKTKAKQALARCWPSKDPTALLETVCDTFPATEMDLQDTLVRMFVDNYEVVQMNCKCTNALAKHGHLAVAVMLEALRRLQEKEEAENHEAKKRRLLDGFDTEEVIGGKPGFIGISGKSG